MGDELSTFPRDQATGLLDVAARTQIADPAAVRRRPH